MTNYLYITEFGDALSVEVSDNTLLDLQTLVGGYIECVTANPRTLGFSADVWVNEEGLFQQGFSINFLASYLTGRQIVGPVVIANVTSEGNTIGLTKQQMARVRKDGMMVDDNDGRNFIVAEAANLRFGAEVIA
jgi:hypothetical protein